MVSGAALASAAPLVAAAPLFARSSGQIAGSAVLLAGLYFAINIAAASLVIASSTRGQARLLWTVRAVAFNAALAIAGLLSFGELLLPALLLWLCALGVELRTSDGMGWEIATAAVWTAGFTLIGLMVIGGLASPF